MGIFDARLTLLTFPQRFTGTHVAVRVLALPKGDPRAALVGGAPAFAGATLRLRARVIPTLERMPEPTDALPPGPPLASTPAGAPGVFDTLAATFNINPALVGNPRPPDTSFKKYLTRSYRTAFAFERPSGSFLVTGDAYQCALEDPRLTDRPPRAPLTDELSWGRVIAYAVRQPVLAAAMGLLFEGEVPVPSPEAFAEGGWLYVELDPASDYATEAAAQPDLVATFAARIPPLLAARPLFAAVVFPVRAAAPGVFDEQFVEAETYDDGFAKIVHGSQPEHGGIIETQQRRGPVVKDIGIRLGWDDEQIAVWMNRQLDPALSTPMGAAAYRIDVRERGTVEWRSLTRARGMVRVGGAELGEFDGEFGVEVMPAQPAARKTGDYWLPAYFATWRGGSIVLRDATTLALAGRDQALAERPFAVPDEGTIPDLRYGQQYDFRVRLVDLSRGGPRVGDERVNPAAAPEALIAFRRYAPPRPVRLARDPSQAEDAPLATFRVLRPLLGYPDAVFAGVPDAEARLVADQDGAIAAEREVGLPDPDVAHVEITVEVRWPDSVGGRGGDARFAPLYTTTRPFSEDPDAPLTIGIEYIDRPNLEGLQAVDPLNSIAGAGAIRVPTSRDVRLRLTAVCRPDPTLDYFGDESARRSPLPAFVQVRAASRDERAVFVPEAASRQIGAFLLQPDPPPEANHAADRLALHLGLGRAGLTFTGRPGHRTLFGCAGALRHTLGPDRSSITFAAAADLVRQWVVAIRVRLNRDWTWDGLAGNGIEIARDGQIVGAMDVPRVLAAQADEADPTTTDLVFFHVIDPAPSPGEFPSEIQTTYTCRARFAEPPTTEDPPSEWTLRLPIAVRPLQTPRLVSAGLAFSPFEASGDYSSTAARTRALWLEFDAPPADPRDRYYARVLAHAPDPMLMRDEAAVPEPVEPPLPIEPELVRLISPGQPADAGALHAMVPLVAPAGESPATTRHLLLPLPEGLGSSSPELFGFFVYEFRVGHDDSRWCTAQARFGPPLRVTGIQHPAPPLTCQVGRTADAIHVEAPYATPVWDGRNVRPRVPSTELWVLLYVQVMQVDGASHRNVLLDRARADPVSVPQSDRWHGDDLLLFGTVRFPQLVLLERLTALGLPRSASLSVLAVELLPEPLVDRFPDPLGGDLGHVRVLRTSPLQPVPAIC